MFRGMQYAAHWRRRNSKICTAKYFVSFVRYSKLQKFTFEYYCKRTKLELVLFCFDTCNSMVKAAQCAESSKTANDNSTSTRGCFLF